MGLLATVARFRGGNTINVDVYQYHAGDWIWVANLTAQPAVIITILDRLRVLEGFQARYSDGRVFYQKF